METNRIQELLKKHIAAECNEAEQKELAELIESTNDETLKSELLQIFEQYEPTIHISHYEKEQKLQEILNTDKPQVKVQRKSIKPFRLIASVAASLLILVSVGLYIGNNKTFQQSKSVIAKAILVSPTQKTSYIRHITLPDGTSVVLKSGSTLHFPKEFNGKTREVTLMGEAYFDVKHINSKPFIIHTGTVKTTVLGTAFDIKAWPGQKNVTVSVTRGKVRVEDDKKVLAVLTVNQSVNYDLRNTDAKQHKVNAEEVVNDWTKQDLVFNRSTFESIAQVLSKRYCMDITISNSELANEKITSSFSGTESLEDILKTLCTINANTQYAIDTHEVTISFKNEK